MYSDETKHNKHILIMVKACSTRQLYKCEPSYARCLELKLLATEFDSSKNGCALIKQPGPLRVKYDAAIVSFIPYFFPLESPKRLNAFTTENPFWGTNYLELVQGGVLGF